MSSPTPGLFEHIGPILHVKSLAASLEHYEQVLGFQRADWVTDDAVFGCAQRDEISIYMTELNQGHPGTWLWIGLTELQPLYDEYQASGAKIIMPPTNYYWAWEMRVEDIDGHVIRFGAEPREDLPFVDP